MDIISIEHYEPTEDDHNDGLILHTLCLMGINPETVVFE